MANPKPRIKQARVGKVSGTPNDSAALQLTDTDAGFLPNVVTTTQRNAIASPATGLTVYNSTTGAIEFYNGSAWVSGGGSPVFTGNIIRTATNALTAVGNNRATALAIVADFNRITTAAASTGVVLPTGVVGMSITVFNAGANPIKVYAQGSETIDGTAGATGVTLTNALRAVYVCMAAGVWISAQLGVVSA